MKYFLIGTVLLAVTSFSSPVKTVQLPAAPSDSSRKIIIITLDGYRWQELFGGADSRIIANTKFTSDSETLNSLYGGASADERRKKLMPFLWNVAARKGRCSATGNLEMK